MGLTEVQRATARLFTDAALRERFFADPEAVARELSLSAEDLALLRQLSAAQTGLFADSLLAKRRHEVEKLLPQTRRVLGHHLAEAFARYAAAPIPGGPHKHRADALAFAAFLEADGLPPDPTWAWDVLRYESAWLEAAAPERRWLFRRFRYAVSELSGERAAVPMRRTTYAFWFRLGRHGRLRHLRWFCR